VSKNSCRWIMMILGAHLLVSGCGSDEASVGSEGGHCRSGAICNEGLVCLSGRCVQYPLDVLDAAEDVTAIELEVRDDSVTQDEPAEDDIDANLPLDSVDSAVDSDMMSSEDTCTPDCIGRTCGDDGCGGSCGECGQDRICDDGTCILKPPDCPGGECLVSAGPFWMGVNRDGTQCPANVLDPRGNEITIWEVPCHVVDIPAYFIERDEVTNGRYQTYLEAVGVDCVNPSDGRPCAPASDTAGRYWCTFGIAGKEDYPVTCLTWAQADGYCRWGGGRLCSEAEWEKAARGTDGRLYPWGNERPSCGFAILSESYDLHSGCGTDMFFPVGSRTAGASPYGVMDMLGNAAEWTQDWFHFSYDGAPTDGTAWDVQEFKLKSVRGGSTRSIDVDLASSYRDRADPDLVQELVGFRCCRTPE
jgi:formylglycine-generating enzyme required for sulfatase activity